MAEKETQIGKAKMNQTPQKPISFKLKDKVVKTNNLDDSSVTSDKIAPLSIGTEHIQDRSITADKVDYSGMDAFVATERERAEEAERQLQSNIDDVADDLSAEVQRSTEKDDQHDGYIRILDQNIQILDNKIDSTNNNLAAEITRSTNKDTEHDSKFNVLASNLSAEVTRATNKENEIAGNIVSEETRAKAAEQQNANGIATINSKIPSAASSQNQLTDKNFVNSSIATNTANYISDGGEPFNSFAELKAYTGQVTNNDYAFVRTTDAAGNTIYKRYKFTAAINAWALEYELNNSSFTSAQWDAINSGITLLLKNKLVALPTNDELIALLAQKQAVINDLQTIRSNAQAGATAYQKPSGGIPSTDMTSEAQASLSKADTAVQPLVLNSYYTKSQTDTLLNGKQDTLTIDQTPTVNSGNPISSDAVYDLQQYTIEGLNGKQAALTFDNMPTAGSGNPVTSGGVYAAIANNSQIRFVEVQTLPEASEETLGKIYVIRQGDTNYQWYVTVYDQSLVPAAYVWRMVNNNSIDLSDYYTIEQIDALLQALADSKQDKLTFATDAECEAAAEELT